MALSLTLPSSDLQIAIVLQRTARKFSKVRAAREARLVFLTRPITFSTCGVVDVVDVINAKAPSWLPTFASVLVSKFLFY